VILLKKRNYKKKKQQRFFETRLKTIIVTHYTCKRVHNGVAFVNRRAVYDMSERIYA